ncbi:aldo/keto reductase [Pseudogemmobacter humi]|uniref:2,5-diketo-D-gluconic acid reductase B n=1 Tax=Pseudogemmobacter humi TaxID=2483812 RepID=A0A3P5XZY2_9RHOB|nr:aldo/keto reductase [Pseudogemmobacter humi]VDC33756.1 2,5-diketo-D-gluconic acid reductase B [Pseudogemmobacter humi]
MANIPELRLTDGVALPAVGFGAWSLNGTQGVEAITSALHSGYRLIDSAFNYENEGAVGEAIRRSGLPRESLRITSKLPGRHHRYDEALATIEESIWRAGLDYYDLYLIHWPNPKQGLYVEAWRALIEARKRGLVRAIGVSNFLPAHLERIMSETGIAPVVNQVEMHPRFPQVEQRAFDKAHGIVTEAWSPLGRGELLKDPVLTAIAERLGRSVGQVVLRWHHQLGSLPLPRSASPARQAENLAIFDFALSPEDMAQIATLARPDGRLRDQDPARYEEF